VLDSAVVLILTFLLEGGEVAETIADGCWIWREGAAAKISANVLYELCCEVGMALALQGLFADSNDEGIVSLAAMLVSSLREPAKSAGLCELRRRCWRYEVDAATGVLADLKLASANRSGLCWLC